MSVLGSVFSFWDLQCSFSYCVFLGIGVIKHCFILKGQNLGQRIHRLMGEIGSYNHLWKVYFVCTSSSFLGVLILKKASPPFPVS